MARPGISQIQVRHDEEPTRLFKSDFLEFFTHIHPAVVLLLFCPVLFYSLWRGAAELGAQSGLGMVATLYGVGFFAWTLVEYIVHRYVFHYEPKSDLLKSIWFLIHGVHHEQPQCKTRLVMPPILSIPLALFFYARGSGVVLPILNYGSGEGLTDLAWIFSPYFDLYDLAKQTAESPKFSGTIRHDAETLMKAVDELVAYSYGGGNYPGFENGRHGVNIFSPSGDRMVPYLNVRHWALQTWYNPSRVMKAPEGLMPKDLDLPKVISLLFAATYGHYLWCSDGATPGNNKVENWFELLDSWFDTGRNATAR